MQEHLKNFNSYEIKNNVIVIFIKIDFKIDCNIDYFNRFSLFLKSTLKNRFTIKVDFQIDFKIEKID